MTHWCQETEYFLAHPALPQPFQSLPLPRRELLFRLLTSYSRLYLHVVNIHVGCSLYFAQHYVQFTYIASSNNLIIFIDLEYFTLGIYHKSFETIFFSLINTSLIFSVRLLGISSPACLVPISGAHAFAFMLSGIAGSQGIRMVSLIDKASKCPKAVYQFLSPSNVWVIRLWAFWWQYGAVLV